MKALGTADRHCRWPQGFTLSIERSTCTTRICPKRETRVLDLAGVGMTVSRILDSIQEPDGLIESAIVNLIEQGALRMETSI